MGNIEQPPQVLEKEATEAVILKVFPERRDDLLEIAACPEGIPWRSRSPLKGSCKW